MKKVTLLVLLCTAGVSFAKSAFTFMLENDARKIRPFGPRSDSGYTNGFTLSYLFEDGNRNYGFSLSQQVFTPRDLGRQDLILEDRPYAGWLYASALAHQREEKGLHTMQASLGIIGPPSLAEPGQKFAHALMGRPLPEGWSNQLKTEPTLSLLYQYRYRLMAFENGMGSRVFDITPTFTATVGNVYLYGGVGAMIRYGYHLSDTFGINKMSPLAPESPVPLSTDFEKDFEIYVFIAGEVRGVARNIFLDGNTFTSSHSVGKRNVVWDYEAGFAIRYRKFQTSWRQSVRGLEEWYHKHPHTFAAMTFTLFFD